MVYKYTNRTNKSLHMCQIDYDKMYIETDCQTDSAFLPPM